jgi:hypothetical protein
VTSTTYNVISNCTNTGSPVIKWVRACNI